jgi:5'-3' exonuclease
MPKYTADTSSEWEVALLKSIKEYVMMLWNISGKPGEVYLAVDGVVPMAKIRQQRLRRFKSVWMTAKERELGVKELGEEIWDTNSITPGTAFMEKLSFELGTLCKARKGWILSGAEEEGEGEQKLMAWVRERPLEWFDGRQIFVYGLDADLILLCMLHSSGDSGSKAKWSILREKQEFGKVGSHLVEAFLLLNVTDLVPVLFPDQYKRTEFLLDYIAGMCLLGNDFVPHSIGIHLREGGHDRLEEVLRLLHGHGLTLVEKRDNRVVWNQKALIYILTKWSATEEEDITHTFRQKHKGRNCGPPRNENERKMMPVTNLPIVWADENRLCDEKVLHDGWKDQYYMEDESGEICTRADILERCRVYCEGLQWILDYYIGQEPVSREWMYAWTYPPLWSDLLKFVKDIEGLPKPPAIEVSRLQPQEQLTMVLPLESFHLIRDVHLKAVPSKLPYFWPNKFGFHSLGKRMMWECPPKIPILVPSRLRVCIK